MSRRLLAHVSTISFAEVKRQLRALTLVPVPFNQALMAGRARHARLLLHDAYYHYQRRKDKTDENEVWRAAVSLFHQATHEAYPPEFDVEYARLKQGESDALETAITFLENDPWFFRSGYIKANLVSFITRQRMSIPPEYAPRLQQIILNVVRSRDRREFRCYCKLARRVDCPELRVHLQDLVDNSQDAGIRRRARWVLEACSRN